MEIKREFSGKIMDSIILPFPQAKKDKERSK